MAGSLPNSKEPLLGAVLSRRWRLVQKLGEGGMGEVYAAEPIDPGGRVAIKILRREFVQDADVRSRFLEEGRTCMRLVHPNIVRVLECAQAEDGCPYIVMELLEGVPLGAYMRHGTRIPIAQAAPILQAILGGLAGAHERGVVHRDLKPDNVFLNRDPSGMFVVKVLDFGIAKVMEAAGGMGNRTRSGMLLGTPAYMSPEQARNARDVDGRADLWSAGVLFYEMVTGRVAFPAPTEYARLTAILSSEPEPIENVDAALTPLSPFVQRALKKNRDERFASASEMGHALAALVPAAPVRVETQGSASAPVALSRLPEVASVLAPPLAGAAGGVGAGTLRTGPGPIATPGDKQPSGGTLASPPSPAFHEGPGPVVLMAPSPLGGTMPSQDGPGFNRSALRRGVPRYLVVVLVVCALVTGLLLGWSLGRTS